MRIETVQIQTYNGEFSGYRVNGNLFFPKENCELIKQWIKEGNNPEAEFTDEEILKKKQYEFRVERNLLLDKVDIEINKAEDLEQDSKVLRVYRQKLRDSTINWVLPESII